MCKQLYRMLGKTRATCDPLPASGAVRILTRETNRFLELATQTGGGKQRTEQHTKEAQWREQLMGCGKWRNTSWRSTVLKSEVFYETVGTVNCLFTPSPSFHTATCHCTAGWAWHPILPWAKNTVQSVNDIFLWFCPKNKKEGKKTGKQPCSARWTALLRKSLGSFPTAQRQWAVSPALAPHIRCA